jgi:RNA polymerase sigma factor (sigma-70 family)
MVTSSVPITAPLGYPVFTDSAVSRVRQPAGQTGGVLSRAEELVLVRGARAGDRYAVERLVRANLGLITREARRFYKTRDSFEDLVQEGVLALVEAIGGYDEERGFRLSTYAHRRVRRAMADAALRDGSSVHSPEVVSLDAPATPGGEAALVELLEDPDAVDPLDGALQRMNGVRLRCLLGDLPERERRVVEDRFGFGDGSPHTVDETSRRLRLPRERVRRIEESAMRRLRTILLAE